MNKIALIVLCAMPLMAHALPYHVPATGFYVGINPGRTEARDLDVASGKSHSETGPSGSIDLGYRLAPQLSGEVGVSYYARSTVKEGVTTQARIYHYSIDAAAKGVWPFRSGFSLYSKLGYAKLYSRYAGSLRHTGGSRVETTYGFFYAVGMEYTATPWLSVQSGYSKLEGNNRTGSFSLYTVGVIITFPD